MAAHKVKKVAVAATDIAGLKSSRYERMQVSYGVVPAASYASGDTITFSDVPSQDVIKARIVAQSGTPVVLDVQPGADLSSPLPVIVSGTPAISYVIEYIRGTGKVGIGAESAHYGEELSITVSAS